MKIKRSELERIVKEELANHIRELTEAPKDDKEPSVVDADNEKKGKEKQGDKDNKKPAPAKKDKAPKEPEEPNELPAEDEPEDAELEKDVSDDDSEEDADEVTGGKIADDLTGKTVQSLTMDPKSKTLPGAQEIVITFREVPDPLKILITKTGQVKFYYKGLHNSLGES